MDPFYETGGFVHDMDDQQYARLMRALGFAVESTADEAYPDPARVVEALTMDGPLPTNATVEPDHLLRLWVQVDRCAQIAAEALAADMLLSADVVVPIGEVKATLATELWACVQDTIGFVRLGQFEEWSE